jgi:hypothetical protein
MTGDTERELVKEMYGRSGGCALSSNSSNSDLRFKGENQILSKESLYD